MDANSGHVNFLTSALQSLGLATPFRSAPSHLETVVWADLGINQGSLPITRSIAMSLPVIRRGRNLITTIARFPLIGMTGTQVSKTQPPILALPEHGRPRFQTITWTLDALLFYGRAWWIVRDYQNGRPTRFEWVPEWETEIIDGQLVKAFGQPVRASDVRRIDAPHDGILTDGGRVIRDALTMAAAASKAADNPVPAVELHQTSGTRPTPDEIKQLITEWEANRRKNGTAYTSENLEARIHGLNPEQLLIEGRKALDLDLARMMGIPAWAIDAQTSGSSLTYSNTPSRSRELLDYTLAPYIAAIEERLSLDDILPAGQWCRFDTSNILREDFQSRMNSYVTALETGVYTLDDLKRLERGNPLES